MQQKTPFVDPKSDYELEALREGNHNAYDNIYLQWRAPIFNLLRKLTMSSDEAEDITQDVFVNLWENRLKVDTTKHIKYYLYLIARQSALKYFRRQKAKGNYIISKEWAEVGPSTSEDIVIEKEIELIKRIVIERMPKQRRKIYEMALDDGLSNEEISVRLGISKESVANQIWLARKDIKEVISLVVMLFFM